LMFQSSSGRNQPKTYSLLKIKTLVKTVFVFISYVFISLLTIIHFSIHGITVLYLGVLFAYSFPLIYLFMFDLLPMMPLMPLNSFKKREDRFK